MGKILRGFWDCEYCEKTHIDGLADTCPECGKQKSDDVHYYMDESSDVLTETELNDAGITIEECDGNHKDWICAYCNQLNDDSNLSCVACGASKKESDQKYGEIKEENTNNSIEEITVTPSIEKKERNTLDSSISNSYLKIALTFLYHFRYACIAGLIACILLFILYPIKEESSVTGFSWDKNITVEEYKTFKESDWTLPAEARLQNINTEFHYYKQVLDHYDTKTRQCSRQVFDGYDTSTSYRDNGNGTFSEVSNQTPRYRTEYYTETYQDPVYRDEPVYDTKYYYEIDRWTPINNYPSDGQDKKPYWNTSYILVEKQRDDLREESYTLCYTITSSQKTYEQKVPYSEWKQTNKGDKKITIKNRLGIVYKTKSIN